MWFVCPWLSGNRTETGPPSFPGKVLAGALDGGGFGWQHRVVSRAQSFGAAAAAIVLSCTRLTAMRGHGASPDRCGAIRTSMCACSCVQSHAASSADGPGIVVLCQCSCEPCFYSLPRDRRSCQYMEMFLYDTINIHIYTYMYTCICV